VGARLLHLTLIIYQLRPMWSALQLPRPVPSPSISPSISTPALVALLTRRELGRKEQSAVLLQSAHRGATARKSVCLSL
jgi:hypothetical protein